MQRRIIITGIFMIIFGGVFAQKEKSLVYAKPAQKVVLSLPQKQVVSSLQKAGGSMVIGVLLFGLGSVIKSSNPTPVMGTILQVGGGASLIYSGINLQKASTNYEKAINQK